MLRGVINFKSQVTAESLCCMGRAGGPGHCGQATVARCSRVHHLHSSQVRSPRGVYWRQFLFSQRTSGQAVTFTSRTSCSLSARSISNARSHGLFVRRQFAYPVGMGSCGHTPINNSRLTFGLAWKKAFILALHSMTGS